MGSECKTQSILVTGWAGFIRTHTVLQLLHQGFHVSIIDNLDNSVEDAVRRVRDLAGPDLSRNLHFHLGDLPNKDEKRRHLKFRPGDHVFLKISPNRGVIRFGRRGKLSPRYIRPFDILERVGEVGYRLALPPLLEGVHNVFHISQLRRYVSDPSHVLDHSELIIQPDLSCEQQPVEILNRKVKSPRNKEVNLVRVMWRKDTLGESTWEREDEMRARYPHLFVN